MDSKGLSFKLATFSLIAASLMIIAIGAWINDWNDIYDSGIAYDLDEYDESDTLSGQAQTQRDRIFVKSTNTGEEFEGTSLRGVFGVLNSIYSSFAIVFGDNGMLDSLQNRFGIPDYPMQSLVNFMTIAIIFALIAVFFKLPRKAV
jgi:hypothetical protein